VGKAAAGGGGADAPAAALIWGMDGLAGPVMGLAGFLFFLKLFI